MTIFCNKFLTLRKLFIVPLLLPLFSCNVTESVLNNEVVTFPNLPSCDPTKTDVRFNAKPANGNEPVFSGDCGEAGPGCLAAAMLLQTADAFFASIRIRYFTNLNCMDPISPNSLQLVNVIPVGQSYTTFVNAGTGLTCGVDYQSIEIAGGLLVQDIPPVLTEAEFFPFVTGSSFSCISPNVSTPNTLSNPLCIPCQ